MDTIAAYLNNMFASLPRTEQTYNLKQDLLANMEEKYHELKKEGKSENEAVGIVISEFGNIDELVEELGLPGGVEDTLLPLLAPEDTWSYTAAKKRAGFMVGIGVVLCMIGPALLIVLVTLAEYGFLRGVLSEDAAGMIGVSILLVLIALAVGMFIYSGSSMERFKYLEKGFNLPCFLRTELEQRRRAYTPTYTLSLTLGICLCVVSPVLVIIWAAVSEDTTGYGAAIMLLLIALAVFLFIYYGTIKESFSFLLKEGEYIELPPEKKEEKRIMGSIAAIVWPLATCIFLISGFVFQRWDINWIVFPVTGILLGIFGSVYNLVKAR
ncbi:permease prefix domain 1-containing protein [Paenibacillus camerounensis]|uniref:permease prefix domain 1-containing protein n=1 Tax=Paenibacillus camerounensis TaxID=1243663 RepID=UPI0005AAD32B|nr:permease prefix domain 1-containing protein [Paenibacillus camerounensis]